MIPELGQLALWAALAVALVLGTLPIAGAQSGRTDWMALARPATGVLALLITASFALLVASFLRDDFSVLYVAQHSNTALPVFYKVAGVWGGHEGSLLLWMLMQVLWAYAVARASRSLPDVFIARVLGVMGLVSVGFLLFTLTTSNPFERLLPPAADGRDLNPLLQDPGMVLHPPALYMGYVGFSVAFSFAIAALIGGNLDAAWARWMRPWTTAAWVSLTLGIGLGSWWAYNELGWGGWWFWDPVENASFMPWLIGTALIHSLAVTEKRGSFKNWTVLLAIMAFSLSLMGTFLVRSGVLSSVHAFATDPARGLFILVFLVLVIGASLLLFAWRAPKVGLGQRFGMVSRESFLLVNNMLLAVATGAVMLGTLYPLFLDALGLGKISVGPPYFDTVFALLMAPLMFVMGVGLLARWKGDELPSLAKRLKWAAGVAVAAALVTGWLAGRFSLQATFALVLTFWIVASLGVDMVERGVRHRPRAWWGMLVAHLGIAVFAFGVTMVKTYDLERDVKMGPGDSTELNGYVFRMIGLKDVRGPNYEAVQATIAVDVGGRTLVTLHPEKRVYRIQRNPMTESAVHSNGWRDLYVSMGEMLPSGEWIVRVQHKPFVSWIWGGCLVMMAGGLLAMSDRRYRSRKTAAAADLPATTAGAAA